jgi:hypothetical protein
MSQGRPFRLPVSMRNRPTAAKARYGAIGRVIRQCHEVQPFLVTRSTRSPPLIACRPSGTRSTTSNVALSRGWSLAANHHGATCGSPRAVASSGSATHGRAPPYETEPGRPW